MSDHDQALAERAETAAQVDADARERHQRVMSAHYRWLITDPDLRRIERVRSGPWCPAGSPREVRMPVDFSYWVEQHHPDPTAVLAALFADTGDDVMERYAAARARADADALGEA